MDDLTKSLLKDMIREELRALLPGAVAEALKAQPKPRASRAKAGPANLTPLRDELATWQRGLEARVENLVNGVESRVSAHLAAAAVVKGGEG